jgi:putative membrane protein
MNKVVHAQDPSRNIPEAPALRTRQGWMEYLSLYLRGLAMGAADAVPGVSGGTIALILGIYEELIQSLRGLSNPKLWGDLLRFRWGSAFKQMHWTFLLTLGLGIATALLTLAHAVTWAQERYPLHLSAFFFGLVGASIYVVARHVRVWHVGVFVAFVLGAVGSYWLVGLTPTTTPSSWWFWIFSGMLAVSALLLPGISGAFILLLLGKYDAALTALKEGDIATILLLLSGIFLGLLTFTRVLGWLFTHYHNVTLGVLAGFLLGSLRKLWPWQLEGLNVSPQAFDNPAFFWPAILLIIFGFGLVLFIDRFDSETTI